MSGLSMTPNETLHQSSPQEVVDSLRSELLSGDEGRARVAAAFIRSSYAIRAQYRQEGMGLALLINGKVESVDPDSPLLPDLTSLVPLVRKLFPLPPDEEPPGFLL